MVRYFFDCDDTLVLYQNMHEKNPYGFYYDQPFLLNERLADGIKAIAVNDPEAMIVIWSGGGMDYARMWKDKFDLPGVSLTKDISTFHLIEEDSIVVDDDSLGGRRTHGPHDWPEEVKEMTVQRPSWYEYFMGFAKAASTRASCPRAQIGAVLVKENRVVATGYNGALPGEPHCIDVGCFMDVHNEHCIRVLHAETNLIAQAAKRNGGADGCDVYIYANRHIEKSCHNCYQIMKAAGVVNIYVRSDGGDTKDTSWEAS